MKVLVTGAGGFVGRNLCAALHEIQLGHDRRPDHGIPELTVYPCDRSCPAETLDGWCADCDFVVHLAGVNRPKDPVEFQQGNADLTAALLGLLETHENTCPVLLASSIQAERDNPYGRSKRAGEEAVFRHAAKTGAEALIYRFPNVFGKWCRPNYNSAIATFCHNTARGLPIQVNDPAVEMDLVYIDDVVEEIIRALRGHANRQPDDFCTVPVHHQATLGQIADTILSFPKLRETLEVPRLDDPLTRKLYSTYLSYLPAEKFLYDLKMNRDHRGSFTEILRTADRGQFSVNISKPGITKGDHWHHTKNEKFVVVKGEGLIRLRRIGKRPDGTDFPIEEFRVSGDRIQVVEMIPGYTHSIVNLSETEDLVTFMWANEPFDPERPDTFSDEV